MAIFWEMVRTAPLNTRVKKRGPRSRAALSAAVVLAMALCIPVASHADFILHHWEDHYEPLGVGSVEGDLLYYSTNQNYDENGNLVTPLGTNGATLQDYHRLGIDVSGQFGVLDRLSIFGRVSWAQFEVDNSSASATTYGFADQTVGADLRVLNAPVAFDLQFQTDIPAYSNSSNAQSGTPYQGDGSVDLSAGGFLSIPLKQMSSGAVSLIGGLGYTYRTQNYSAEIPWIVSAGYLPQANASGIFGSISGFGISSLKTDSTTLFPQTGGFLTGSGGSFITNAINPSLITLGGEIGYQLSSGNQILAAVDQSVWGQDSPQGTDVILGFRMNFGGTPSPGEYEKSNRGFEEYSLDAKVTAVNDRLNLVKIDKGTDDGLVPGQIFDIFSVGQDGRIIEAVARCRVTSVKSDEAALAIIEYFKRVWINEGYVAKRLAQ